MNENGDHHSALAENTKIGLIIAFFAQSLGIASWKPRIFCYEDIAESSRMTLESISRTKTNAIKHKKKRECSTSFAWPSSAGLNRKEGFQAQPVWTG